MDIWWSLHLRREPASVPLARHILLGTMASAGVDPDISHEVGVALTEACANAVEHAGPVGDTGEDSGFQVTATIEGGCLRVQVTDSGPGFSADPADPGCHPLSAASRSPLAAATRIRPCAARVRRRRRVVPALARPASRPGVHADGHPDAHLDARPATGPTARPLAVPGLPGIPEDAGTELPDLDATSGRGLFLIRALVDHVQFHHHPRGGAVVSFDKMLTYRERPLLHAS